MGPRVALLLALVAAAKALTTAPTRRAALQRAAAAALVAAPTRPARAEYDYYKECAAVPRALVINCEDVPATAAFLSEALGMEVSAAGGDGAFAAFGPTQLSRPGDFLPGVSSLDRDGGHAALELRPATNVAAPDLERDCVLYVQVALPGQFRASRILRYGGELRDGYGVWSVGAPGGLPLRLLVGDERRDRLMYVAYRCANVKKSVAFYETQGFRKAPYPRARPPTRLESPFDPEPPRGAVYMETCADGFGVLLTPSRKRPAAPPEGRVAAVGALRVAGGVPGVDPDGNALEGFDGF